jgi:hypothetical protein
MTCLSWYIDMQYLTDDAPLLSSLPDAYSQFLVKYPALEGLGFYAGCPALGSSNP